MIVKTNLKNLFVTVSGHQCFGRALFATQAFKPNIEDKNALKFDAIPGPSALGLLRGFLPYGKFYKKSRLEFSNILRTEYGDLIKIPTVTRKENLVLLFDPVYFEMVYRTEGVWPHRLSFETMKHYRYVKNPETFAVGSLITEQGERWGKFRSLVNPVMMQPKTVKIYVPKMEKVTSQLINRIRQIRDSKTFEVPGTFERELNQWALESIAVVALDTHLGVIGSIDENSDGSKLIAAVNEIFTSEVDTGLNFDLWRYIETAPFKKLMKAYDDVTNISRKYIEEAIERYTKVADADKSDINKSVVERLININKDVAVVLALEMFFAGVDTTTSAITGCLLALAKNPDKQEKLRMELLKILPDKETSITEEKLHSLPYLRAFIKESLRVYPVANENARAAGQDIIVAGYEIPKGTNILMMNASLYKNEKYFTNPGQFIPERWLRNQENSNKECPASGKSTNPFVYLPFGFGSRMCIGKRIVEMEMEIALAKITRNFHVEFDYADDDVFTMKQIFTPMKELKFKFTDIE